MDILEFEKKNGLSFKDKGLLKQAFIHRSYINENRKLNLDHNERLEFLGDAVLELIVTDHLFKKYKDKTEGELTSYRSALVNANTLSTVAMNLGVNNYLMLSKGEAKDMGRARQYILADTMEAIIGAIFIDRGYEKAESFVLENIVSLEEEIIKGGVWIDAKSHLQEKTQDVLG
ncbi:ribonuclease III, partial [Candidatus Nomurabacteria bacterium]|nr:ribonuclease III [Candidatus Nomurabacteria bacterium]